MTFRKPDLLFLFIILTGILLRFYGFPNIPFMYDEVSAWARTGFTSFHELIDKGVKGDGHPAGIQVFLNYWRMIAGDSEAAFKLPFLIMGVTCIWLVFRIGKFWFNKTVGYLSAAFVASIQYTIMYSQIARPYISGLFFSLMMVWCWTNYFFNQEEKHRRRQLAGYIFFSVLCCYNHYFSLLFAFVVGTTGLFFLLKDNWKEYLVAGSIIVISFLPHLPVTIYQLGIGGVGGWLSRPTPQFYFDYLAYIFHFSKVVEIFAVILILLSIIFYNKDIGGKQKFRIVSLAWFLIPMLIGYYYSVTRNAVLQFSVLIFSFPYFLFFIFSLFRNLSLKYNWLLVTLILFICTITLVNRRSYYEIFYKQPIEQLVKNSIQESKQLEGKKYTVLINEPKKYVSYYLQKFNSVLSMDYWAVRDFQTYPQFRKYLSSLSSDFFIAGNIPADYLLQVREFYPYEFKTEKGFTYNYFCFAKEPDHYKTISESVFKDSMNLVKAGNRWSLPSELIVTDSTNLSLSYRMDSLHEWGPSFNSPLHTLITNPYNTLNVRMHVNHVTPGCKASLVVSFEDGKKNLFWQEKPFNFFLDSTENEGYIFYSISIRDIDFGRSDPELKVYVWNKNKDNFNIRDFRIEFDEGNPKIYGLIEPLPHSIRIR